MNDTTIHAYGKRAIATACLLSAATWSGAVLADATPGAYSGQSARAGAPVVRGDDVQDALNHVNEAVQVLRKMEADPALRSVLGRAVGVFVVPDYGRAALGIGVRGGPGVLFVKRGGIWSDPSFYTLGGISAGIQAGVEGGSIAMILNNQQALNSFKQGNNFSLNADAGLTVLAWSAKGQASAGKGDVTLWSDTAGLFGDVAISVTDINFNEEETTAYYGQRITEPHMVINGQVRNPHAAVLERIIVILPSSGSSGSSGGSGGTSGGSD